MRAAISLIALLLAAGAAPLSAAPPTMQAPMPGETRLAPGKICTDQIQEVREERGLAKLDRDNAAPDEPLLIAAVDKRIDGCSVLVMMNDTSDVRPLPTVPEGPARLRRVR